MRHSTSIRLSEDAKELIRKLAERLGINRSAVIEMAVRQLAQREHVR